MCSVSEDERCYEFNPSYRQHFERCPRSVLKQVLADAGKAFSLTMLAGFELEL